MATGYTWITPITDRTLQDVEYAKAHPTSENDLKGALNRSDLLRIGNNIVIILNMMGYISLANNLYPGSQILPNATLYPGRSALIPEDPDVLVIYNVPEIPTVSYYRKLQKFLDLIVNLGFVYDTTPQVPTHPYNTYDKWNDIEQILEDAKKILDEAVGSALFTGNDELYCGNFLI